MYYLSSKSPGYLEKDGRDIFLEVISIIFFGSLKFREYDEDRTHAVVALWIESEDFFTYLYCNEETIHITTVVCGAPIYYVNDMADAICWLTAQGNIISGIEKIPRFRISANTKYKHDIK